MANGRLDLKTPCRNCPFRTDDEAIRFHGQMRALEIYLTAQKWGFPCHKSAELTDGLDTDETSEPGGYVFRPDGKTQHCVGALIMMLREGHRWTEGTGMSKKVFEDLRARMDPDAPVFNNVSEFLGANNGHD